MKIAIVGSRTFDDYELLKETLEPYKAKITTVISGGAKGADTLAEKWADKNGIEKDIYPADWDKHGKSAGYIRNTEMIKECDGCVAFWDGKSKGTQHSFKLCEQYDKPLKIVEF